MGQIRVLIAEDDLPLREVMTEVILDEPAFELVGAVGDAGAAIELAAAELPDVVLVDVRMPAGGGLAATRGILEVSARSSVIAFTGHDDGAVATELFEAGCPATW
jgi:two-component system, NarL family, nitrate/nitrite response regulator NarL